MAAPTSFREASPRTGPEKSRIVKIRNMTGSKRSEDARVIVPVRSISNPSPLKKSASNRHPSQTHTRTPVDDAIAHELAKARYLMQDLADHVFGHIVSTELARDILRVFIDDGVIQVLERSGARAQDPKVLLSPDSDDIQSAMQDAFEDADLHDCHHPDQSGFSSADGHEADEKLKRKSIYSFKWTTFPGEPLKEDELVSFMNDITDRAFAIAAPKLPVIDPQLHHRFAAPADKTHAVPLSYEPDGEDMRPDFLLLPIEAFSDDLKTFDQRYVNFTAARMVGESKNRDLAMGIEQMQRYARGLKRAQPWVHYVLGMAVTKDKVVFLRGEGSGTERIELILSDGRGCLEFIRILLGLALANQEDLGCNPDVELNGEEQKCVARNVSYHSQSPGPHSMRTKNSLVSDRLLRAALTKDGSSPSSGSSHPRSSSTLSQQPFSSATSSKRVRSDMDDESETRRWKKRKMGEDVVEVDRFIFYPLRVYGHKCVGLLFTASSIRGRGTTVFSVADLGDEERLLALKMAWQDLGRSPEQEAVIERLRSSDPHSNVIIPIKTFVPRKDGKPFTTLGGIRGFLEDQIEQLLIENRILTVSVFELKRPVKYFWGVHDFVRGLRGALLGDEYLTRIGVLHRDISENNIVLGRRPGEERGYLIDFDMAIVQEREEPTPVVPAMCTVSFSQSPGAKSSALFETDDVKPIKGIRTGTFPYISYNVLFGGRHTQFDDVESFLYVLLLFFFSYAGPLSEAELRIADENGFIHPIGSGRLPHTRNWPKEYTDWADGNPRYVARLKHSLVMAPIGLTGITQSVEFVNCLENNWPEELHRPIAHLVEALFRIFRDSTRRTETKDSRTEVSHGAFVDVLDKWLESYVELEDKFSNCPFKNSV